MNRLLVALLSAFDALIAAAVGGYVLAHENLHLPGWVPVLGHEYYELKAEFQTAQAVTPGQGQTVRVSGVPRLDSRSRARTPIASSVWRSPPSSP